MSYGTLLRYPGSKWKVSKEIIKLFPHHKVYLEPFFGSGAIFFNKPQVRLETINDKDNEVVNLFKVIRDYPNDMAKKINHTPYSREEYMKSYEHTDDEIEKARRFLVRMWQAYGPKTNGSNPGWGRSIKYEGPNRPYQWAKVPGIILKITERLKRTQIENKDALELIKEYDVPNTLIYLDPPYLLDTRNAKVTMYKHEYSTKDHENLLNIISDLKHAKVVISTYENELYEKKLKGWNKEEFNSYSIAGSLRKEVVYMNYRNQNKLF